MALTGKKRVFADAVLAGSTNKEAAIAAGYSPATAAQSGSRMAKDKAIVAFVAEQRGAAPTAKASKPPVVSSPAEGNEPPRIPTVAYYDDPEQFLMAQMNDDRLDPRERRDAAKALMPFKHQKLGEGGKKDQKLANAKAVAQGRFGAPPPPPKLVHSK